MLLVGGFSHLLKDREAAPRQREKGVEELRVAAGVFTEVFHILALTGQSTKFYMFLTFVSTQMHSFFLILFNNLA